MRDEHCAAERGGAAATESGGAGVGRAGGAARQVVSSCGASRSFWTHSCGCSSELFQEMEMQRMSMMQSGGTGYDNFSYNNN